MGTPLPVTVLGTGAMGSALASALLDAGHPTTVWNRTRSRTEPLAARGAAVATDPADAVAASPLVVTCLLDHDSVAEVLAAAAPALEGRDLVELTTTIPSEARSLSAWAGERGVGFLDGGIMAVPEMIGQPGSLLLCSGDASVYERHRPVLDRWGRTDYLGRDAGHAALQDLAILTPMYLLFAGFLQGAAMVAADGIRAVELAERATPFLAAMTGALAEFARIVDERAYDGPGQQSLEFSDLSDLLRATEEQGVSTALLAPLQGLIEQQVAAGHGAEGFARIVEGLRPSRVAA